MYLSLIFLGVFLGISSPSFFKLNKTQIHGYFMAQLSFDLSISILLPPYSRLPSYFSAAFWLGSPHLLCLIPNSLQSACRRILVKWKSFILQISLLKAFQDHARFGPEHLFCPGLTWFLWAVPVLTLLWLGSFLASKHVLSLGFPPYSVNTQTQIMYVPRRVIPGSPRPGQDRLNVYLFLTICPYINFFFHANIYYTRHCSNLHTFVYLIFTKHCKTDAVRILFSSPFLS